MSYMLFCIILDLPDAKGQDGQSYNRKHSEQGVY